MNDKHFLKKEFTSIDAIKEASYPNTDSENSKEMHGGNFELPEKVPRMRKRVKERYQKV